MADVPVASAMFASAAVVARPGARPRRLGACFLRSRFIVSIYV